MKVVHLSTTDFGGAYKATERIQESLEYYNEQSNILVRSRFFETNTTEIMDDLVKKFFSKARNFLNLLLSEGEIISDEFGADLSKHPMIQQADIIFLHWVNSFVSAKSIKKLEKLHKPIVWVMHDMWVFTGGCHYDAYCGRYEKECGCCPFLKKKKEKDISSQNLKKKKHLFESTNIKFVAISNWEMECALNSSPLKGKNITLIPNPININLFRPLQDSKLRRKYGLNRKKIILFGADKALENKTKGFQFLIEALHNLNGDEYMAVCFGNAPKKNRIVLNTMDIIYLGVIQNESELAEWYNIADVFVAPSLQEAFGYTVCEALACGTPVVAFNVGGMLDQIKHKENGYLSELYNSKDLADGIVFCSENKEKLGKAAREGIVNNNSYKVIGKKYQNMCTDLMLNHNLKNS